jgi:hypothetical protein
MRKFYLPRLEAIFSLSESSRSGFIRNRQGGV